MVRVVAPVSVFLMVFGAFAPRVAEAAVYWARPDGIFDLSGDDGICASIRSTNTTGETRDNEPSQFGSIATAAACAKAAGDVVNISGMHGIYDSSDMRHVIKSDNTSITPSFALHDGESGNPRLSRGCRATRIPSGAPPWGYLR